MKVEYELDDGSKGKAIREVNSPAEREEIAGQICKALVMGGEIGLYQLSVRLTYTVYRNCSYDHKREEVLCDETGVEFDADVPPIAYMDIVIPMVIEQVDDGWGIDEVSPLLYLEKILIGVGYRGEELSQLTETVDPFREAWELSF